MAASGSEASSQANSGKLGLEKGKAILDESSEKNNCKIDLNSSEIPPSPLGKVPENGDKALLEQVPPKADPQINQKGESSDDSQTLSPPHSPPPPPQKNPIKCKFCGAKFNTTQALGGHQNAHKHEREMQRAARAAQQYGPNPFIFQSPGTRTSWLQGSYYGGHQFQYPAYHGLATRGWQPKPIYSNPGMGYVQGSLALPQAAGGLAGPSSMRPVNLAFDPGWPRPYPHTLGSVIGHNGSANFNHFAPSNMTSYMQPMQVRENELGFPRRRYIESTGLSLSLNRNQSAEIGSSANPNDPTKLDLTLKL